MKINIKRPLSKSYPLIIFNNNILYISINCKAQGTDLFYNKKSVLIEKGV